MEMCTPNLEMFEATCTKLRAMLKEPELWKQPVKEKLLVKVEERVK